MNTEKDFDVGIFCALVEEVTAVRETFGSAIWNRKHDPFIQRDYYQCVIQNKDGEDLRIHLSWLPNVGPLEMAIHGTRVLDHYNHFRVLLMTGICAGDKDKVKLGDLVIAEEAWAFDAGKAHLDEHGFYQLSPEPDAKPLNRGLLYALKDFDAWKAVVYAEHRPPSKRQQREQLMEKLAEWSSLNDIPKGWLKINCSSDSS